MSCIFKFEPVHKRTLGFFGYTLLEAQSLLENERTALRDRIQDALSGVDNKKAPEGLFDESDLIPVDVWEALDDLTEMICWSAGQTVLVDNGEGWSASLPDHRTSSVRPLCLDAPMPDCNLLEGIELDNIGYTEGILKDGTPFAAELYSRGPHTIAMNIILPEIPQYISSKNIGTASDFPDSFVEAEDNGILAMGMIYRERQSSLEELVYYTCYLEDMGILSFVSEMREGDLEILTDRRGNPVVCDRVTLVDNGKTIAKPHLKFKPFPEGPNRYFEDEWASYLFEDLQTEDLFNADAQNEQPIPPYCVFEDGEWRPCPYDD
ncbi:hypothetical protein [Adlercreutzia sp. ZJ154]|uniref:hypothetical protein n=1 Tax=Adlercreutzia sp. ZJ154 TaxID=2709790 RepID=UPI0013ED1FD2|nr:hypothetical protein [Adlercreutzia sp. ZJ154]